MNLPRIPELPWKSWGAALVLLLALTWLWSRDHVKLAGAYQQAEAARLQLAGQIVSDQDTAGQLKASVSSLLEQNDLLREAYEQLAKAAPDAKPESSARLETGVVKVVVEAQAPDDPSLHPPMPPPCDAPLVPDGKGGFVCPTSPPKKPAAQCVLSEGDLGSFRVDEVVARTEKGNRLIAGTAEFWRETPPRSKLAAGKFSASLSDVDTLAQAPEPRWGVEAAAMCTQGGCGLGAGLLLPPFRVPLLGLRGEARVDAYAGPSLALAAGLGVRW